MEQHRNILRALLVAILSVLVVSGVAQGGAQQDSFRLSGEGEEKGLFSTWRREVGIRVWKNPTTGEVLIQGNLSQEESPEGRPAEGSANRTAGQDGS